MRLRVAKTGKIRSEDNCADRIFYHIIAFPCRKPSKDRFRFIL
jgi:hypothetical protein